jgi:hypothetical protein
MPVDFGRLGGAGDSESVLAPRQIFSVLPSNRSRYPYLRDVQAEVLHQWFGRRTENSVTLKMNTGSGKTVVGLLILKSCMNEGVGPAVYISPTPYLLQQVAAEAGDLGIECTQDPRAPAFLRGRCVLLANIHKLINGKSVFGVAEEGIKIEIGSLVIDDAHACLSAAEEQFRFTLNADHEVYAKLFALFKGDLQQQSPTGVLDLESQDPQSLMLVPYWAWQRHLDHVRKILHDARLDTEIEWSWPLLKNHLALCRCVFAGARVEITPRCLPIDTIPSFSNARRRIFMSATVSDDSVLITDFNIDPSSVQQAICPSSGNDIGDRMILVPQELNPDLGDDHVKELLTSFSGKWNVVVIVPSGYRAQYWSDVAAHSLTAENLVTGIERLKRGHVGLVVLVNKYDGIDLPNDACRVLAIDGLPDVRRDIDKVKQAILSQSQPAVVQSIQRIEQGMGRGIRSNDDYCAVILLGRSLVSRLYAGGGIEKFTAATRAQLELSDKLSEQLHGQDILEIEVAIERFLARDKQWVKASRAALLNVRYSPEGLANPNAVNERRAFNAASIGDYSAAIAEIQQAVNRTAERRPKGWLLYELAEYTDRVNAVDSQQILRAAVECSPQITKPLQGIEYVRVRPLDVRQASQCLEYLREHFPDGNRLIVAVNGYLDDLVFRPGTAPIFEEAMKNVARLIGFDSQRPEAEYGVGPDVLWSIGGLRYLVIECKNGTTTQTIAKRDCDQLSGSMHWFATKYDATCKPIPVMVHFAITVDKAAACHPEMRVINEENLAEFKTALRAFAVAVAALGNFGDTKQVRALLKSTRLDGDSLVQSCTAAYNSAR